MRGFGVSKSPSLRNCPALMKCLPTQAASYWLKRALRSSLSRDPVDAAHDSDVLARLLGRRCDEILSAH